MTTQTKEETAAHLMAMLVAGRDAEEEIFKLDDKEFATMVLAVTGTWRPLVAKIHEGNIHSWKEKCTQPVKDLSRNATELVNAMAILMLYTATLKAAGCDNVLLLCAKISEMANTLSDKALTEGMQTWDTGGKLS